MPIDHTFKSLAYGYREGEVNRVFSKSYLSKQRAFKNRWSKYKYYFVNTEISYLPNKFIIYFEFLKTLLFTLITFMKILLTVIFVMKIQIKDED